MNFLKAEKCRARKLLPYFDLFAYRRAVPLDESMPENYGRNYAFGFAFRRTESAENDNLTKGDNEKTIFDIPWYIESTRGHILRIRLSLMLRAAMNYRNNSAGKRGFFLLLLFL